MSFWCGVFMNNVDEYLGIVYWITGLSGAGKTTIGKCLYSKLKKNKSNVIFLDGDILREVFGDDLGYSRDDRHKSAMRNSRISYMISLQGIDVICCTISMFDDVRNWNRNNIKNYREVYLKVSDEILIKRNQKGLYESSKEELVGFGVDVEYPKYPDLIINNDGEESPEEIASNIINAFSL